MAIRRVYGRGEVDEERARRAFSDDSKLGGKVRGRVFCNGHTVELCFRLPDHYSFFHTKLNSRRLTAPKCIFFQEGYHSL